MARGHLTRLGLRVGGDVAHPVITRMHEMMRDDDLVLPRILVLNGI